MNALSNERIAYFNGNYVPESEVRVPFRDRSWLYGDGAFDMTRTFNGRVFKIQEHIERLYRSLKYLRIDPGLSPAQMIEISEEVSARNRHLLGPDEDHWVGQRISRGVHRAEGDNWDHYGPTVIVECMPLPLQARARLFRDGIDVIVPSVRRVPPELADPARQDPQLSEPGHGRPRGARPRSRVLGGAARPPGQSVRGARQQHLRGAGRRAAHALRALRAAGGEPGDGDRACSGTRTSSAARPTSTCTTPTMPRRCS